jgi:hypothetical protein
LHADTGDVAGLVEIRVWPWLALRGFRVTIADRVVYTEGKLKMPVTSPPASSRA